MSVTLPNNFDFFVNVDPFIGRPLIQKVFLTNYEEAQCMFANMIVLPSHIYVVDEDCMVIERIETLSEAQEFFNPTPVDFKNILSGLIQALECSSYNSAPGHLVGGSPLEIEPLDLSQFKMIEYNEGPLRLWPSIKTQCEHELKHYQGFTEQYNYCEKCGEKNV